MPSNKLSDKEKIQWFNRGMRFAVEAKYVFEMVSFKNGQPAWAIYSWESFWSENRQVLNSNCEWEDDLDMESRDPNFEIRTRFDFDTALDIYQMYKDVYP